MEDCIFCKIVKGQIPCYQVYENEDFLAFLDIHPIKPGHSLVIPKFHENYIFDIENSLLEKYILAAKAVADILKKAFNPKSGKVGMIAYGQDADHAHLHLVPIDKPGDLSFAKAKTTSSQKLAVTLQKIKQFS